MAGPFRTPQKYTFHTEMRGARGVITNLNAISRALDVTRLSATKTLQMDKQLRTLAVAMQGAKNNATGLAQASLGLANATGASVDNTVKLVTAYQMAGRTMASLTSSADEAFDAFSNMNSESTRTLRAQANLVDLFGMGAAAVLEFTAQTEHLGINFGKLLGSAAVFQRKFEMPGVMRELGKVVGFANSMMVQFGETTIGRSQDVINATLKVGTIYSKAYGIDISKGIDMARQQQQKFISESQANRDVFLGLSESFGGLSKPLFEAGMGINEVNRMMDLGRKDPIAYAEEILKVRDSLKITAGGNYAERFFQQIIRQSDPATRRLLTVTGAIEKAVETRKMMGDAGLVQFDIEKSGKLEDFENLVGSLRSIGSITIESFKNLSGMFKTIVGTAFAGSITKALEGLVPVAERFNASIFAIAQNFTKSEVWEWLEPYFVGVARVLVAVGSGAAQLAEAFAATIIPTKLLMGTLKSIPVVGKPIGFTIDKIASGLVSFAKSSFNALAGITGIGVALEDFGDALRVTQKPTTLVVRAFRAMAIGIVETFDGMLGGIPTWLVKQFFPDMVGTLGSNTKLLFQKFQIWLEHGVHDSTTGMWNVAKKLFDKHVKKLNDWFDKGLGPNGTFIANATLWGENIGRAIGTASKWVWELITPLFDVATWEEGWDEVVGFFEGVGSDKAKTGVEGALHKVMKVFKKFSISMIDEIMRPWGQGWIEVEEYYTSWIDSVKLGFNWLTNAGFRKAEAGWLSFKLGFIDAFYEIRDTAIHVFEILSHIIDTVVGTIDRAIGGIRESYHDNAQTANWIGIGPIDAATIAFKEKYYGSEAALETATALDHGDDYAAILQHRQDKKAGSRQKMRGQHTLDTRSFTEDQIRDRDASRREATRMATFYNTAHDQVRLGVLENRLVKVDYQKINGVQVPVGLKSVDSDEMNPLKGSLTEGGRNYKDFSNAQAKEQTARRALQPEKITSRNKESDRVARLRIWANDWASQIRSPYITKLGGIMTSLAALRTGWGAQDSDHARTQASWYNQLYGLVERAQGSISEAQTPNVIQDKWAEVMTTLEATGYDAGANALPPPAKPAPTIGDAIDRTGKFVPPMMNNSEPSAASGAMGGMMGAMGPAAAQATEIRLTFEKTGDALIDAFLEAMNARRIHRE